MPMSVLPATFAQTGVFTRCAGAVPAAFQVVGERSSGTNLLHRLVARNTGLEARADLGWKHGFPSALAVPADLAVICAVREPERWALSMFAKPWHTPPPMQELGFSEFIRAPWASIVDRARYFNGAHALVGQPLLADRDPVSGEIFDNIFALRRAKLRGMLSYAARVDTFAVVRTETLQGDAEHTIDALAQGLGLGKRDAPFRPVTRRLGSKFKPAVATRPPGPERMSESDKAFMRDALDPHIEQTLGYSI